MITTFSAGVVSFLTELDIAGITPVTNISQSSSILKLWRLSHRAEFLILDEATSGLDPIIRDDILDILIDFVQNENHSVLVSSHITSDLEKIADYITFLHKGKIVFSYLKDDLIDNYGIISCGASTFDIFDQAEIVAYRKEDYQYKILVKDRKSIAQKYSNAIIEPATIEEIMLFYVKGELQ